MLKEGVLLQEDIEGNVQADKLANIGTNMHSNIDDIVKELHDKKQVTTVTQKMLLNIWEAFI